MIDRRNRHSPETSSTSYRSRDRDRDRDRDYRARDRNYNRDRVRSRSPRRRPALSPDDNRRGQDRRNGGYPHRDNGDQGRRRALYNDRPSSRSRSRSPRFRDSRPSDRLNHDRENRFPPRGADESRARDGRPDFSGKSITFVQGSRDSDRNGQPLSSRNVKSAPHSGRGPANPWPTPEADTRHGGCSNEKDKGSTRTFNGISEDVNYDAPEVDEAALIEERRRRREAIMAKYRDTRPSPSAESPAIPDTTSPGAVPSNTIETVVNDEADMMEDTNSPIFATKLRAEAEPIQSPPAAPEPATSKPDPDDGDDVDMLASDDDMFASKSPTGQAANGKPQAKALDMSMLDNWDDPQGYYRIILGELLDNRYHVQASLGKGVFSNVVRAYDTVTEKLVAIKLIRNNETMYKAGLKEISILEQLKEADPADRRHVIRLERSFDHKSHLCMVFEHLDINLREVLGKFGKYVVHNFKAVRTYAHQMFLSLLLLQQADIIHADIKPDNMLVNEEGNILKLSDLGSASDASEAEITPYLVSRFYRAPEIILGLTPTLSIDMWSVGCTLFELYRGKILFTGKSNNGMLKSVMDCRGKFPVRFLRKCPLARSHFDDEFDKFLASEPDPITGQATVRPITIGPKPPRELKTLLFPHGSATAAAASRSMSDADIRELSDFVDLLDKCLQLNPEKRITPTEALKHPFVTKKRS